MAKKILIILLLSFTVINANEYAWDGVHFLGSYFICDNAISFGLESERAFLLTVSCGLAWELSDEIYARSGNRSFDKLLDKRGLSTSDMALNIAGGAIALLTNRIIEIRIMTSEIKQIKIIYQF